MKINRLFQIVYILLEKQTIPAKELAQRFEVSIRTIYRDIETLSQSGIPIYTSQGKGGGISLLDSFVLDKSTLTEQEQQQILMALKQLQATQFVDVDQTLERLATVFQVASLNWISIDFTGWGTSSSDPSKFDTIRDAIIDSCQIQFNYFGVSGQSGVRVIEPQQIMFKNRAWYLQGYCLEKQAPRLFKINRMQEVKRIDLTFVPQPIIEKILEQESKTSSLEVVLAFPKKIAFRVYDEFDAPQIDEKDGQLYVTAYYIEDDWLYSYLLSFGINLTIISPSHLKDTLREKSLEVAQHYQ